MARRTPQTKTKKQTVFTKAQDPPFEPYWDKVKVQEGLKREDLIQGNLRINQKNFEEAYVGDPAGGPDFFIVGVLSRNRALNDDCVVIQVLPMDQWTIPESDRVSEPSTCETETAGVATDTSVTTDHSVQNTPSTIDQTGGDKPTLVDVLYAPPPPSEISTADEGQSTRNAVPNNVRRTAKVVYIVEKVHCRASAGYLKAYDKAKQLALFSPRDNRVPRVFVPLSHCPPDFSSDMKKYENNLFVCYIEDWPEHSPLPHGKLMRSLGEAGQVERESEAFLIENDVDYSEFSDAVLACLPQQLPWSIPQEELEKRRDFRKECVFTIDPDTARDLDDALHLKKLDDGNLEVGVHIADVSYFVAPGTALDKVASQRATSVYLVQKVIPMLPRLLCEQLCSLNPNEDRLTFSVVWTLSKKGEFISDWFGRSIICSCAKLSYDHAQLMIDGEKRHDSFPPIHGGFTSDQVAEAVSTLNELACALSAQRQSKGTLRLNQVKLKYSLDAATGLPSGCQRYKHKPSNRMIEEFMLMANMAVARKCCEKYPEQAMLRRHSPPKSKAMDMLCTKLMELGFDLDPSTAGSIQASLDSYCSQTSDADSEKLILVSQCSKAMELAKYFCAGSTDVEKYHHYALNVPFYTHFTSPIRRYADIIVHRQLGAALDKEAFYMQQCSDIQEQAEHCNKKKKSAKTVQELSSELFLALFIKECGPFEDKGMVTLVLDKAFDVFSKEFGVIKRVYCEKLPLKNFNFKSGGKDQSSELTLEWEHSGSIVKQVLKLFSIVKISIRSGSNPLQYEMVVHSPTVADSS